MYLYRHSEVRLTDIVTHSLYVSLQAFWGPPHRYCNTQSLCIFTGILRSASQTEVMKSKIQLLEEAFNKTFPEQSQKVSLVKQVTLFSHKALRAIIATLLWYWQFVSASLTNLVNTIESKPFGVSRSNLAYKLCMKMGRHPLLFRKKFEYWPWGQACEQDKDKFESVLLSHLALLFHKGGYSLFTLKVRHW